MSFEIRPVQKNELGILVKLIRELADFEKFLDKCTVTEEILAEEFFGNSINKAKAFAYLFHAGNEVVGYMIAFYNFSTFRGKSAMYLEDLYVSPQHRGKGYGKKALAYLAKLAVENDCPRLDWCVLNWNVDAIRFYKSIGAEPLSEWTTYRLTGDTLKNFARED